MSASSGAEEQASFRDNGVDVAAYELCLFAELRDRLRAGDIWVVGSRQYRAVEDQLIAKALFTTMKTTGPLPVAVSSDASAYLQERRTLLNERLSVSAVQPILAAIDDIAAHCDACSS